jgi:hypothetical protein
MPTTFWSYTGCCKAQSSGPKRVWDTRGDHTNTNVICKVNVVEAVQLATVLQYRYPQGTSLCCTQIESPACLRQLSCMPTAGPSSITASVPLRTLSSSFLRPGSALASLPRHSQRPDPAVAPLPTHPSRGLSGPVGRENTRLPILANAGSPRREPCQGGAGNAAAGGGNSAAEPSSKHALIRPLRRDTIDALRAAAAA